MIAFSKYHGLGNDFVIVDEGAPLDLDAIRALCERSTGVGADGVLFVGSDPPSMRVVNADGSMAEMCGNGLRCAVWHLARQGRWKGDGDFLTYAGPHRCVLHGDEDVEVWMAAPTFAADAIPASEAMRDLPVQVGGRTLHVTAVGMGNPHVVTFDEVGEARRELGPLLQSDVRFPRGVNVGFASPTPDGFALHVLERGAGWTRACGTGACAAVAAAVATGRAKRHTPVNVRLPGGAMTIVIGEEGEPARMRGSARHVFDGTLD